MDFEVSRPPTPDEKDYQVTMDNIQKKIDSNPEIKKELNIKRKEAFSTLYTQYYNGTSLLQDKELRFFLYEFNSRMWNHGFGAMPSSFNVLEGFYKWNAELFYFELLEEEEHFFSLYDFFDFVTSNECSNSIDYFIENVEDELIYSYNIHNEIKELTFSTSNSKKYVIGGVSFVKRANEVFMLLVAGELGDTEEISKSISDYDVNSMLKSYIKPAAGLQTEAVKLLGHKDIWKVNVYVRIDLDKRTIDSRYIQKDTGIMFTTISDDYEMIKASIEDKLTLNQVLETQAKDIANYEAIFEAAFSCLFLPEYFDLNDDLVLREEHPTNLYDKTLKKPLLKKSLKFSSKYFHKTKDVWVLDKNVDPVTGKTKLMRSKLKIEKDGYWKQLNLGQIGIDKNGNEIHGRTWVEKHLSWQELTITSKPIEISIPASKSAKKGYIYILRNPAHELDLFKIGLTTNTVEERAKQLFKTSSPDAFLIVNRWFVNDCFLAEKLVHMKLANFRVNAKREFFKIKLEEAIKEISPIIEQVNKNDTNKSK